MNEKNTVWIQLYTPGGAKLGVTIGFQDGKFTETLPPVALIDAMIAEGGYLLNAPGLAVDEDLETITHVIRRTQHNDDGTQTPCLGLYFENPKLIYAKKAYLNTPEDIATFERLSGLTVASMPNYPGQIPLRSDKDAASYIVAAKTPFQVIMADDTYTDKETGEVKPTKKFAGFYGVDVTPQPATTGNATASGKSGSPDNVTQGNFTPPATTGNGDGEDTSWLPKIYTLTEFLYDGVQKHQYNSISKLIQERSITRDMKPIVAASMVFAYKAYEKLRLSQDDITDQLGKSLGDYLRSGKTLQDAWQDIQPPVDLAPTGTDDIPF